MSPVVDELLNESNGLLLWDYQLVNLYCLFDRDRQKADKFRRDRNQGKLNAIKLAKTLKFNKGITLEDVIHERCFLLGGVRSPNIRGAYHLYKLLFE